MFKCYNMLKFLNKIYGYYTKIVFKSFTIDNTVSDITDYVILREETPDPAGEFIPDARPSRYC